MVTFDFFDPGFGYPYGQTHRLKEEKTMTKEEALKKIEELKAYVEKCEEKEKEIPEMNTNCLRDVNQCEIKTSLCSNFNRYITFQNQDTNAIWAIMSIELAHLLYAREYLKVDVDKYLRAREHGDEVFKIIFVVTDCRYEVVDVFNHQVLNENDRVWCFTNEDDANRVRDYLNKYVKDVKRNMY